MRIKFVNFSFQIFAHFLSPLEVGPPKNFRNKSKAQLCHKVIFLSLFELHFWIPWVLKPLPSNFQQSPMTTDEKIKDFKKF